MFRPLTAPKAITRVIAGTVAVAICSLGLSSPAAAGVAEEKAAATLQLIVTMKPGTSPAQRGGLAARNGGADVRDVAKLNKRIVRVPSSEVTQYLAKYRADSSVAAVEVSRVRKAAGTPSDPSYADQWALPKIGWDTVYGQPVAGSATIAVLDTGVDGTNPDLSGRLVAGYSAFGTGAETTDPNGHGTWLSSIAAAATDNAEGIAGVAYAGAKIMPVQVLDASGNGQDADVISGITYAADNGADVILMGFSDPGYSQALQDAVDYAWSKGAVIVAATGNGGSSTSTYPAGDAKVVGVSGTTSSDTLASGSNYGEDAFIGAPGVGVLADAVGGGTKSVSGTSASAAIVAGAAALLKASDSAASNGAVVGRLARNADPAGSVAETGNGRVNLARSLADTSTAEVVPVGTNGALTGGPFVGPYTSAALTITATFNTSATSIDVTMTGSDPNANKFYIYSYFPPGTPVTGTPAHVGACLDGLAGGADSYVLPVGYSVGTWIITVDRFNNSADCTGRTAKTVLGQANAVVTVSIRGAVLNDLNGNGLEDDGGAPLAGATVFLYRDANANGTLETASDTNLGSSTSSATGAYSFGGSLTAATYFVLRANPSGYASTNAVPGTGAGSLSTKVSNDILKVVISTSGAQSTANDFLAQQVNASISGTVYSDANGDGTLDAGETGNAGVTVTRTGTGTTSATTNANGTYTFSGLAAGTYSLDYTVPANYTNTGTKPLAGVVVAAGAAVSGKNFFAQNSGGSIAGTVYNDANGNGSLDAGETGIAGVTVSRTGSVTTTTNASGAYSFTGLTAATYSIDYTVPTGYANTGTRPLSVAVAAGQTVANQNLFARRTTATAISSNLNPSTYGGSVTYTATVTSGAGNPNSLGTVTFSDGATVLCSGVALSANTASCSTAALKSGSHSITAVYSGTSTSPGYSGSTSPTLTQTVNSAPLTITGDNASRTYGDPNPAFTASYSGFVNGDTVVSLGGALTLTTSAVPASSVGTYAIVPSGQTSSNYAITFVNGTLTVIKATLTVTADPKSRGYGDANPAFTATISGFKNGQTLGTSGVTGSPACTSAAGASSPVGPYAITCAQGTLAAANYDFSYVAGTLTVTKATLTVTADPKSRGYGDANPTFTATISGFQNGQTLGTSDVTGTASCTSAATASTPAGSYAITCTQGTLAAANYDFTYIAGTLTVTKATITVTANDKTRAYGDANPTFTASYAGFVNGQTLATSAISGVPSLTTLATASSHVGSYPINAAVGTLSSANYDFAFVAGTLSITRAPLTITAANASKVYGQANPALTGSIVGLQNGDAIT
ncbi:MAG: MBG domain-containing protein, partial [Pseudonocardiales bacterium]